MSWAAPDLHERVKGSVSLQAQRRIGRVLLHGLSDLDVHGLANVPSTGPVVLVMNHRSFLDGPLAFSFLDRPVSFLVKRQFR